MRIRVMTDGEPVGTIENGPDGRFKFAGNEPELKRLASLYSELAVEAHGHDPDKVTVDDVLGVMLQRMGRGHRTWAEESPLSRGEKYASQARTAAALAIIEHRLEEMASGQEIEGADDTRASLAELADDPEELSKVLGTVDLAWVAYGTSRSGKTRWRDDETGRLRYQKTRPGEHAEKRQKAQADAAKGQLHLDKIVRGTADADDLRGLAEHVGAMTKKQLIEVRQKLRARFKNGATRDQMVAALRQHVAGKLERDELHVLEPEKKRQKGPSESLAAIIRRRGGIDPKSLAFLASYSGVKEAIQDGIPLGIFKTGGAGLDSIAQELEGSGHFRTPEDRHAPDYLLELIKAGVDSAHKDATDEHEAAMKEYYQALEEAHGEHSQPEIDEAIRGGEEAADRENETGEGNAGEGQLGEGQEGVDDSFDFGANEKEPAFELTPEDYANPIVSMDGYATHPANSHTIVGGEDDSFRGSPEWIAANPFQAASSDEKVRGLKPHPNPALPDQTRPTIPDQATADYVNNYTWGYDGEMNAALRNTGEPPPGLFGGDPAQTNFLADTLLSSDYAAIVAAGADSKKLKPVLAKMHPIDVKGIANKFAANPNDLDDVAGALSNFIDNGGLNSGKPDKDGPKMFAALQGLFKSAKPFKPPVMVYRGISRLDNDRLSAMEDAARAALASGKPVAIPGFHSTSTDAKTGQGFTGPVMFRIKAVHGLDVRPYSHFETEDEMLLNHNAQFVVKNVSLNDKGKLVIDMEQLPPDRHDAKPSTI